MSTSTINIASHLVEMARLQPTSPALYTAGPRGKWKTTTFRELNDHSDALAHGLSNLGISAGTRAALCLKPGIDFFAVTFALFKLGAIPVLIDPGIGLKNFGQCLAQAKPSAFIGIPLAHLLRRLLRWAKQTLTINITTNWFGGIPLNSIAHSPPIQNSEFKIQNSTAAAVLFTSGSTGPAKGVLYTHENFNGQIDALKQTYNITPGEIDLATFPLFGLFGPALGMAAVIPVMDFTRPGFVDPRNILDPIHQLSITNMFGSPALIDRVSRYGEQHNIKLPSLKRVISAGAPASAPTLARFSKMLESHTQIFTPYGATEALPVSSIGSHEILRETSLLTDQGQGVCIGKPVTNIRARIIPITDAPISAWSDDLALPPETIGEIAVQGPVVTHEYFELSEATSLSKIAAPSDPPNPSVPQCLSASVPSPYHRMGDIGYFDAHGRLWFCGRKSQRVRTPAGDLYSTPFEAIFNTHPEVARSALVGIKQNGVTEPVICIERIKHARTPRAKMTAELGALSQKHAHTRIIKHFLFHPRFPVDIRHNAKINREQLSQWAQRKFK